MTQARRESRVVCRKGRESRKLSVRFARTLFPLLNAILTFSNYSHTVSRVSPFSILSIFRTISLHEREGGVKEVGEMRILEIYSD